MNASWITQFEHHLEQLENCAAETQTTPERAAQSAAEALRILGDVADLTVDIRRGLQRSRVFPAADAACTTPAIAASQPTATTDNSDDQLFKEAVRAQQVASVRLSDSAGDGAIRWCCVRPLADGIDCAVAVTSHLLTADNRSFREGFQACGDLLSGVVGRNLLTRHEQLQQARREVGHVLTRLTAATCEADVASIAAQDISAAVTCALLAAVRDRPHNIRQPLSKSSEDCRVSFLVAGRAVLKVRAVTGVSRPHPESETVRGIEAVAGEIQRTGRWNVWLDSADCEAL
ncbi:MAG: hypothetical protein KDA89_20920, partial [Planctomycetaceae bacterium]|nr:hypothetical protein [Planctomycetaceae bacterium]